MVSGFGATHKYWFQTETKLRTVAALGCRGAARIVSVLSCVSAETWGFTLAPRGFCSLDVVLQVQLH